MRTARRALIAGAAAFAACFLSAVGSNADAPPMTVPAGTSAHPAVLLGDGPRLVLLDPNDGSELAAFEPLQTRAPVWTRFQQSGGFLLAEAVAGKDAANQPSERALAFFDAAGRIAWTSLHPLGERVSKHVFLNDQGIVVYDSPHGAKIVLPDGTVARHLARGAVPLGPVVADSLLTAGAGDWRASWHIGVTSPHGGGTLTDLAPALPADKTEIVPHYQASSVVLLRALRSSIDRGGAAFEVVRHVPLPAECRFGEETWPSIDESLSPRYWLLTCRGARKYALDVDLGRFRALPSDVDTIAPDGSTLTIERNGCDARLVRRAGGRLVQAVQLEWGYEPERPRLVCGHVVIDMGTRGNCSKPKAASSPNRAYVLQANGSWLGLPHRVSSGVCSPDSRVAFVGLENGARTLVITHLDRSSRRTFARPGLQPRTPMAWVTWLR